MYILKGGPSNIYFPIYIGRYHPIYSKAPSNIFIVPIRWSLPIYCILEGTIQYILEGPFQYILEGPFQYILEGPFQYIHSTNWMVASNIYWMVPSNIYWMVASNIYWKVPSNIFEGSFQYIRRYLPIYS